MCGIGGILFGRGGKDCYRSGNKYRRQKQGYDRNFFRFHNGCDPFFYYVFAEVIAKGRQPALDLLHTNEDAGVGGPCVMAEAADNGLVAG